MPLIYHPSLRRELEVSDQAAETLTTVPRSPWRRGPLPKPKRTTRTTRSTRTHPTATSPVPEEGTTNPTSEEG